jgi:hypothetical protein
MSDFVHGEAELADALGLPVKLLQKNRTRQLVQESHWGLNRGHVAYTDLGARLAVQMLSPDFEKNGGATIAVLLEKSRLRLNGELPEVAGIVHRFFPNPNLVEFKLPDDVLVNVRVQSKKNLRLGMSLRLRALPEGGYELGQRLPRSMREGRRNASGA